MAQVAEIADQMRGRADKRQIKDPRYGLAQNTGGIGSAATVAILEAI